MVRSDTILVTGEEYVPPPPPPKKPSGITFDVNPITGTVPFNVYISGRLYDADSLLGLIGRYVQIYKDGAKLGSPISCGSGGTFSKSDTVRDVGAHSYYAEFAGDGEYEGCVKAGDIKDQGRAYGWLGQKPLLY